jgi:hypothetical protein
MKTPSVIAFLRRNALPVVFFTCGAAALAVLVLRHSEYADLGASLSGDAEKLDRIRRNARFASTLPDDLEKLEGYAARVKASMVDPSAKAGNLAYLYGTGARCGLLVTRAEQIVPAAGEKSGLKNYALVNFELGVEGDFAGIVRFLDRLRADRFFLSFDSIEMAPSRTQTASGLAATIRMSVLAKAQEEAAK